MKWTKQKSIHTNSKRQRCAKKVLFYSVNALYPSTMLGDMPCGKEVVVHWPQMPGDVEKVCRFLQQDRWFGFAKVNIKGSRDLWKEFEEMPPLFCNNPIPSEPHSQGSLLPTYGVRERDRGWVWSFVSKTKLILKEESFVFLLFCLISIVIVKSRLLPSRFEVSFPPCFIAVFMSL